MKIGRNDSCPCGSGRKYKQCCIEARPPELLFEQEAPKEVPWEVREAFIRHQQEEQERTRRFGHVRSTISTDFAGHKIVAVGSRLHWANNWRTFHDFLISYIKTVSGSDWGNAELKKPFEERHPVLQWYQHLCEFQEKYADQREDGIIYSATATGPVMAFLALAYDLYTLEHHALLQGKLVNRLKVKDQFQGARYETYVAAAFVRAGFDVELEDEGDRQTTHCEFTATHQATGAKYSIEAKSRHRSGLLGQPGSPKPFDEIKADVSTLIARALRKQADYERVIFIDVNVPPQESSVFDAEGFGKVASQLELLEASQRPDKPRPAAFVFFTNHPYHYVGADALEPGKTTVLSGINMPDFKPPDIGILPRKYPAIFDLFNSLLQHTEIPHEF